MYDDQVRMDIYQRIASESLPIRGWHLSMTTRPGKKYAYGVVNSRKELLFNLGSMEVLITADFRLEICTQLCGQVFKCPPEAAKKQVLFFRNTNGTLELILDGNQVPPYQEMLHYPDWEVWNAKVEEYTELWKRSDKSDRALRWVLGQLDEIRYSGNHMLHQALLRLTSRIEKDLPDYWFFAELAIMGRLTEKEIELLNSYELGKGAIIIKQVSRPVMGEPSGKVQ
jgi:hypothetical protein